jgi:PAS domain S-box-containing protein
MSRSTGIFGLAVLPVPMAAVVVAALVEAAWHLASPRDLAVDLAVLAGLILVGFVSWLFQASSRREAAQLQESEARQRAIIDAAGEVVIVIDDQATITTFNRAAERMFGYAAAEMIGTSLEQLMTDGGRQAHAAYLAKYGVTAMVEAARLRTVHKGVRKRGDVFPFELTMSEWRDGDRRMFTGVMRDVTERERTADALRESQARFAALFESSGEPLFVFELAGDGGFVMEAMNRVAEERTGFSRFALKGCPPDELAAPEDARTLRRMLLRCLDAPSGVTEEVRLQTLAGPHSFRLVLTPMRDASGEIRRVLVSGRDLPPSLSRADALSAQSAA